MTNEELAASLSLASEAAALTHHVTWAELMGKAALAIEDLLSRCTECRETTDKAIENINKAWHEKYEKEIPKWIPVTERLPEIKEHHVSDTVLVYLSDGGMSFSELEENIFGQVWFDIERPSPDGESDYTVTHWMPLPDPTKGE